MLSDATMEVGTRAAGALLGVDALYRAESGDPTGLVCLNMDTEGRYASATYATYDDAVAAFEDLRRAASTLPEVDRRLYYEQLCHSTLAFIAWRTGGIPFDRQLSDFLHGPAAPASDAELDALRTEIRAGLDDLGYTGDIKTQAAAWEARHTVPRDSVGEVLTDLLSQAWDRTEEAIGGMPGPRSDGMAVKTVSDVSFNARCDFSVRTIDINVDPTLTRPGLKHLAVHEGYPGHWLQFKTRQTMAYDGTAAPDVLLSVVNSASSSVFEGIADYGIHMIDWANEPDDRLQALFTVYRAAIGTGAAWRLHGLGETEEAATDWLRSQCLTGGEGWVLNRMKFIAAPERAVLIWSYWWGEPAVKAAFAGVAAEDAAAFREYLYGRMHSVKSVGMFGTCDA
jgi:hypothetical protein